MREKKTTIQSVKTTSWRETRHDQHFGKSTSKTIVALDKALNVLKIRGSVLQCRVCGKADLGGRVALLGSDGQCVFMHSIHGVECAREVRAAWRALVLPDSEGPGDDAE